MDAVERIKEVLKIGEEIRACGLRIHRLENTEIESEEEAKQRFSSIKREYTNLLNKITFIMENQSFPKGAHTPLSDFIHVLTQRRNTYEALLRNMVEIEQPNRDKDDELHQNLISLQEEIQDPKNKIRYEYIPSWDHAAVELSALGWINDAEIAFEKAKKSGSYLDYKKAINRYNAAKTFLADQSIEISKKLIQNYEAYTEDPMPAFWKTTFNELDRILRDRINEALDSCNSKLNACDKALLSTQESKNRSAQESDSLAALNAVNERAKAERAIISQKAHTSDEESTERAKQEARASAIIDTMKKIEQAERALMSAQTRVFANKKDEIIKNESVRRSHKEQYALQTMKQLHQVESLYRDIPELAFLPHKYKLLGGTALPARIQAARQAHAKGDYADARRLYGEVLAQVATIYGQYKLLEVPDAHTERLEKAFREGYQAKIVTLQMAKTPSSSLDPTSSKTSLSSSSSDDLSSNPSVSSKNVTPTETPAGSHARLFSPQTSTKKTTAAPPLKPK